jgi:hypothetical protein
MSFDGQIAEHIPGTSFSVKSVEVAAVVVFVVTVVAVLAIVLRESAPPNLAGVTSAPLIVGEADNDATGRFHRSSLYLLDPDTLADVAGTTPLEPGPCASDPIVDARRRTAVIALDGGTSSTTACPPSSTLHLRLIDVQNWQWTGNINLEGAAGQTLELAWTPASSPVVRSRMARRCMCSPSVVTATHSTG